jgi:hypothetical protein
VEPDAESSRDRRSGRVTAAALRLTPDAYDEAPSHERTQAAGPLLGA